MLSSAGCRTAGYGPDRAALSGAPSKETIAAMQAIKSLAGNWTGKGPADFGDRALKSTFAVSSMGSAVREVMAPGEQHEMTNMYHLDGDRIILTHYCGAGNQPRMAAAHPTNPKRIVFELESVTNYSATDEGFMGRVVIEIPDDKHMVQNWTQYKDMSGAINGGEFAFAYKKD